MSDRIHSIAERVQRRGTLQVKRFKDKNELKAWASRIGTAYNNAFVNNWEYFPLTDREIKFILDNILVIADPRLIKVITHGDDVVGFLFGFHDISAALQRAKGHLFPIGLPALLLELRRTKWIALNGAGILPEYQGRGGNALLYAEMEKTLKDFGFEHADLTQIADTAVQMRSDLINIGGKLTRPIVYMRRNCRGRPKCLRSGRTYSLALSPCHAVHFRQPLLQGQHRAAMLETHLDQIGLRNHGWFDQR